jgi:DNA-binding FadR family transcriptional regulator
MLDMDQTESRREVRPNKPLRGPVLNEAIRDYIKQYILDQGLSAGDSLPPETQLAQELGVGRSSVREAIKALQALGIVEVRHGDGLYVREYNLDPVLETVSYGMRFEESSLLELAQARIWLETAIIPDAIRKIGPEDVAVLESVIDRWQKGIQAGETDIRFLTEQDKQFHRALYAALGNQTLLKLLEVFWTAFGNFLLHYRNEPVVDLSDHEAILRAVQARDPALARQALLQNLLRMQERVLMAMESMSSTKERS